MTNLILWAETALLPGGWADAVRVDVVGGRIAAVAAGAAPVGRRVGCLLPAGQNLHSHAFQRAMAGMTEAKGPVSQAGGADTFWTWRALMFRFLDHLTPDDVGAITAFAHIEMLEAGYAGVTEFHYLHHRPGGEPYADLAEMASRIVAASAETGIGLTLLPVAYAQGGCDGRSLAPGQVRFGNDMDRFARLWQASATAVAHLAADAGMGVAPHSLRAVPAAMMSDVAALAPDWPIHIHAAEQRAEVDEVLAATGARPVEWLLANVDLGPRWCAIHATQMLRHETEGLAASGAVAGLCPVTEANLGDGIFDGVRFAAAGGRFGVGTDSNVRIGLAHELRGLEYAQRLRDGGRAMLAEAGRSTGHVLWEDAAKGGAQAAGREAGAIAIGSWADLVAPDMGGVDLEGRRGDAILDALVFARGDVAEVWSAGRHVVTEGSHIARDGIEARYRRVMRDLLGRL